MKIPDRRPGAGAACITAHIAVHRASSADDARAHSSSITPARDAILVPWRRSPDLARRDSLVAVAASPGCAEQVVLEPKGCPSRHLAARHRRAPPSLDVGDHLFGAP